MLTEEEVSSVTNDELYEEYCNARKKMASFYSIPAPTSDGAELAWSTAEFEVLEYLDMISNEMNKRGMRL